MLLCPIFPSCGSKARLFAASIWVVLATVMATGCGREAAQSLPAHSEGGADDGGEPEQGQCAGLDEITCGSRAGCSAVRGVTGAGLTVYAGCRSSGDDAPLCNTVLTCAYSVGPPANCLRFADTCVPNGWKVDVGCTSAVCSNADGGTASEDASTSTNCSGLDKDTCSATTDCAAVFGNDQAGQAVYAGCRYNGTDAKLCNTVLTCGLLGSEGVCLRFADSCLPDGWTPDVSCSAAGCPGASDASADTNPVCTGLDEGTCRGTAKCTAVLGTDQAGVSTYAGCRRNGEDAPLCNTVLTCGYQDGPGGLCLWFGDTCLPDGWIVDVACQTAGCPVAP